MSSTPNRPLSYNKPWLSIPQQLLKLESRGLIIGDRRIAQDFLWHLNYYRFSGYCLAFEQNRHTFVAGTTFEQIKASYQFDVSLRDLLTEALEVIEVDSRSTIAHIFGNKYGAFGHLESSNFRASFKHSDWLDRVRIEAGRSSERFVTHFKNNYIEFPDLPCWIATEVTTFGTVSKMYEGLLDQCQSPIANRYGLQKGDLESTLHHLSYVRNVCAHHSRVWDRVWSIMPRVPNGKAWQQPLMPSKNTIFVTLIIIYRVLKQCAASRAFAVEWRRRVNELMRSPPSAVDALQRMGMPVYWYKHPYWV